MLLDWYGLHSEMALLDLNEESDGVLLCHCNVEVEESGDYVKHTVEVSE